MNTVPVLVAGGGPVGMMLANVLAHFGVRCMLVERNGSTTRHPKMDITNSRSMELFRRFGLSDALRRVAIPEDHPFDVAWITNLTGYELHRFPYPSPASIREIIRTTNDGSMPLEPPMRVSQVEIEPVLKAAIDSSPHVDVRFGVAFESMETHHDHVVVRLRNQSSGEQDTVRCDYLVACDGGASAVRESIPIKLGGLPQVGRLYMIHFRSTARELLQRWGVAWHYQSPLGTMIAQNDSDIWTIHTPVPPGQDPALLDPRALVEAFVGTSFPFEVLVANPWTPHLLLADSYGTERVFLAGDSAHQYIPTGGYGMNTGIGDAVDLGWKLAATVQGWGGPQLLPSYEAERRPVGLRNREASGRHMQNRAAVGAVYALLANGVVDAPEARQNAGEQIAGLGNAENESFGIEHGFVYEKSPVLVGEPEEPFPFDPLIYQPTTRPGARLPSVLLRDGSALYDLLGAAFTLLNFGKADSAPFETAAISQGVPLHVVTLDEPELARIYGDGMLLVRPDQHIAWRGADALDAPQILRVATGHGAAP